MNSRAGASAISPEMSDARPRMLSLLVIDDDDATRGVLAELIASFGVSFLLQRVYELVFGNNVRSAPVASGCDGSAG